MRDLSRIARRDMTIAIYLPSLRGGGAERSILTLANAFAARGLAVDLVLAKAAGPFLHEVGQGVRLIDLNSRGVLASLPGLIQYLKQVKPVSVLSALSHANVIAVLARGLAGVSTRLVLSERNTLSSSITGGASVAARLLPYLMRIAYRQADAVIAVSKGVADDLAGSIDLSRERITVIYNPVVTEELLFRSKCPLDHPWFSPQEPPVLLAAGRLTAQKDYPTLLRAFARLRRHRVLRLVILGDGPDRKTLESMANELGVANDVCLPGFVTNPFNWMRKSAVFVLSSRWEGLPGVLIQAMACGTPVVSTNCPSGPSEVLENGRWGRLVRVGDDEGLANAISGTLDDQNRPDVAARANAFGAENAVNRYLELLHAAPVQAGVH
jgi:glycosyltransferase involved in cell wall biosynthesis